MDSQYTDRSHDSAANRSARPTKASRRKCLKTLAAGCLFAPSLSVFADTGHAAQTLNAEELANSKQPPGKAIREALAEPDRRIALYNTHTHESVVATFFSNGEYDQNALHKLNLFLRDHRENEAMVMDQMLFTQMWMINKLLESEATFDIVSGYRTPKTNEYLRSKGSGVARFSYHMVGRAIDLRMRDVPTTAVRDAAKQLNAGGVGFYASSDFVHIDTGESRQWG